MTTRIERETLADGTLRLATERASYTIRRLRPGALHMVIAGQEMGEIGRAAIGEVAAEAALHPPLRLLIDMTALTHVATAVSEDWTAWFRVSRPSIKRVDVLAPSPNVRLVVAVSQKFSETEKIMRVHTDPTSFADALREAASPGSARAV